MKKYGGYILTIIITFIVSVTATVLIVPEFVKSEQIEKTISEVSITETNTIKEAIQKVYRSVIAVEATERGGIVTGSGFVYKTDDKYGYILTNNHVVEDALSVQIIDVEGVETEAEVLGTDIYMDIAVLRVDKKAILQVASIGDSSSSEIGDTVFTVGSPEGRKYIGTVTKGILSGKNREVTVPLTSGNYIMSVLQTDAAINPGNSGGPLVNINGEVIGINALKLVENEIEGMGFAIPIEEVMLYTGRLEEGEEIERPVFGVELIDASNLYLRRYYNIPLSSDIDEGVIIYRITENSPAEKAKLQAGDVIIEVDGTKVSDSTHFRYLLYKHSVGETMKVKYIRDGKEEETEVLLTN